MSAGRLSEKELAALWRTGQRTLLTWRQSNILISDSSKVTDEPPHWYLYETIDTYIRSGLDPALQHLAGKIPSVRELLAYEAQTGAPALLVLGEVVQRTGLHNDNVYRKARTGEIISFRLPSGSRKLFPAMLVPERVQLAEPGVALRTAGKILGLGDTALAALLESEPPKLQRVSGTPGPGIIISDASLNDYLKHHLQRDAKGACFMSPDQWRELRRNHHYDELLSTSVIRREWHTHGRVVREAIASGELPCLRTAGGHARVPRHAVVKWMGTRRP